MLLRNTTKYRLMSDQIFQKSLTKVWQLCYVSIFFYFDVAILSVPFLGEKGSAASIIEW